MKKHHKLRLTAETIRRLSSANLRIAAGGRTPAPSDIDTGCCNDDSGQCPSGRQTE